MTHSLNDLKKLIARRERLQAWREWTRAEAAAHPEAPRPLPGALRLYYTLVSALALSVLAAYGAIYVNFILWTWLLHVEL